MDLLFLFSMSLYAEVNALQLQMDQAMWHRKRAADLEAYKISLLIEHLKGYLMVGEAVVWEGEEDEAGVVGAGVDVEGEEALGNLYVPRVKKK